MKFIDNFDKSSFNGVFVLKICVEWIKELGEKNWKLYVEIFFLRRFVLKGMREEEKLEREWVGKESGDKGEFFRNVRNSICMCWSGLYSMEGNIGGVGKRRSNC